MGKFARKARRAAEADSRKATKKAIIKAVKQQAKIRAFKRNAAKTVKEKMIKQAVQKAVEGTSLEGKVKLDPDEQLPESIGDDGSIAVPNPEEAK